MAEGVTITLRDPAQRRRAHECVKDCPDGWSATFAPETRTQAQNRLLWPLLTQIRCEVRYFGRELTQADWKNLFVASLRSSEVIPTLDGRSVMPLGLSTRVMSKAEFSDLLEVIHAYAAEKGVVFRAERGVEEMAR